MFGFLCISLFVVDAKQADAALPLGKPFGGRIVKLFPCIHPIGIAFKMINLAGAGANFVGPLPLETFIWSPLRGSRTYLYLPPIHSGQAVIGLSGLPMVCVTPSFDDIKGTFVIMMGASF